MSFVEKIDGILGIPSFENTEASIDYWDQVLGKLKTIETEISDGIQELNNKIRDIGDDSAGEDQIASIKATETNVEGLLRNYSKLLLDMDSIIHANGSQNQKSLYYRFREVYKELNSSYLHSKGNASRKISRIELFSQQYSDKQTEDSETQLLLKEMASARNSVRMADSYLESASLSHENLRNQRSRLQKSSGVLNSITSRFPQISHLTQSISNRRNRDNLIVAVFIAICICFCLWYSLH